MIKPFLIIAATLLLASCSSDDTDLKQELQALTKDVRRGVDPIPAVGDLEAFKYEAFDLADPFQPSARQPKARTGSAPPN